MFMASTPSSAERPLWGALAAWADIPLKVNFPDIFELVDRGLALFDEPGCQ